jgi:hypothetical protein
VRGELKRRRKLLHLRLANHEQDQDREKLQLLSVVMELELRASCHIEWSTEPVSKL